MSRAKEKRIRQIRRARARLEAARREGVERFATVALHATSAMRAVLWNQYLPEGEAPWDWTPEEREAYERVRAEWQAKRKREEQQIARKLADRRTRWRERWQAEGLPQTRIGQAVREAL